MHGVGHDVALVHTINHRSQKPGSILTAVGWLHTRRATLLSSHGLQIRFSAIRQWRRFVHTIWLSRELGNILIDVYMHLAGVLLNTVESIIANMFLCFVLAIAFSSGMGLYCLCLQQCLNYQKRTEDQWRLARSERARAGYHLSYLTGVGQS